MKILLCDLHISLMGHNLGHVQNAINYLTSNPDSQEYIFLVNPLPEGTIKLSKTNNIQVEYISEHDFNKCDAQKNHLRKAKLEWQIIKKFAEKHQVQRVVLMELDMYQMAIGSSKTSFNISGIWMRPFSRIEPANNSSKEKLKTKIWLLQKNTTMRWCCRNEKVDNIFVFNDQETVDKMNRRFGWHFTYLPDPIYPYPTKENFNIRRTYSLDNQQVIYLIFGAIDGRKNVVNILKAFQKLTDEEAKKACLMIVGKIVSSYKKELQETLEETQKLQPNLKIIIESRFVDDDEMESFFAQSDVILRMNVNFFASSGIIGIAAKHNKPSIVSDYGLVAELTEQYKLGIAENPDNIEGISKVIRHYLENPDALQIDGRAFYKKHDPATFVKTLVNIND
jgi:glycosyltransferase involved in cell wall biosynthesis